MTQLLVVIERVLGICIHNLDPKLNTVLIIVTNLIH